MTQIETLEGIANYLGISLRQVHRLKSALEPVLMTRVKSRVCADGKRRYYKVYYSLPNLLDAWQLKRGGL